MTETAFKSAGELAQQIREMTISSLELTDYFIDRLDGELNAVVVRDFERARRSAKEADAKLAGGEITGPLHGLPIGLQAVGAEYDDLVTIDFARLIAGEIGGFVPPPDYR